MAFLCPSGLGRSKQRRDIHNSILERVEGNVGLDSVPRTQYPEALVLHNFTASSREELTVRQGQKIHILLREGDWVYVVNSDKKEGFIPFTASAQIVPAQSKKGLKEDISLIGNNTSVKKQIEKVNNNTYNVKKSVIIHREPNQQLDNSFYSNFTDDSFVSSDWSNNTHKHNVPVGTSNNKLESQSGDHYDDNRNIIKSFFESTPYEKLPKFLEIFSSMPKEGDAEDHTSDELSPRGRICSEDPNESSFMSEGSIEVLDDTYIALFDFRGRHTDDVDVRRDERVTVLDKSDPFWYWIKKDSGKEGYVPSNYIGHTEDPKVTALIGKRKQRDGAYKSGSHSPACKCEECFNTSPFSETSSMASSTLNSETKHRPPKPPRTRKQTPRDSVRANRKQSSDNRQKGGESTGKSKPERNSCNDKHPSKLSAHHLSLENLSVKSDKTHISDYDEETCQDQIKLRHSRKRSSRHKRPNYREYRSNSQRSYTFEESSDYFDAYFCDEPDPNFKTGSDDKDNVVIVAEILKTRSASTGTTKGSSNKNTWMKSGSANHGHSILNLRQFMQTLPSTSIGNENDTKNGANVPDMLSKSEKKVKSDKHNESQTKNLDWSFGYPRKVRSNQNSINSSSHAVHKQEGIKLRLTESSSAIQTNKHAHKRSDKDEKNSRDVKSVGSQTDINDISVQVPDFDNPSDQMFLDLLSATDNLLEVSEKILTNTKSRKKTHDALSDTGGDRLSSSSETNGDVDEKCSHFIMNQVIDTDVGQLTSRSENSIALSSERNKHIVIGNKTTYEDCESENYFNKCESILDKFAPEPNPCPDSNPLLTTNVDKQSGSHDSQSNHDQTRNNMNHSIEIERISVKSCDGNDSGFLTAKKLSATSDTDCVFEDSTNCLDVHGVTEFVVQFDYEPESDMALPIIKNEILHISLDIQEDEHWYWAFSPRLRTYGYVPKQYVKIPLVTII